MKKILALFFVFFGFSQTLAHPLDISTNFLSIKSSSAKITSYLHTYEIEYLLSQNGIQPKNIKTYYENSEIIKKYIKENINFLNGGQKCEIGEINILQKEDYEIISKGLEVSYEFTCKNEIKTGDVEIKLFTNFLLQTNKLTVYDLNKGVLNQKPIKFTVLTSKQKSTNFDLEKNQVLKDSDGDGLSDEDEKLNKTDPYNIDTDGDGYTDFEEINNSFNPISPDLSPWQQKREKIPEEIIPGIKNKLSQKTEIEEKDFITNFFEKTIKDINDFTKNKSPIGFFGILFLVFILGFLHAFGPGHSKSILISYILDNNKKFKDGLLFSLIFSVTHLLDIVVVFLLAKFVLKIYDIGNYIVYLQRFSLVILIILSLFLIYKSFYKNQKESKNLNLKTGLIYGFLTGLAPCSFGWSIFLLLFSLGNLELIPILLFALGLGIFVCLLLILLLTLILRNKFYSKIDSLSRYSSILSSLFILVLSLILLINLF